MDVDYDWLTLEKDETVVWATTPHPYSLVPALLVGLPLAVVLVGIAIIVGAYLHYQNVNYVVTTAALYRKTGILSRNVQRIEFDKVQDTSYRQSFLGAQFGYGTVDISTAGGSGVEMSFGNVAEPREVQSLINERLRDQRIHSGPERDADAVLEEILGELQTIRHALEVDPSQGGSSRSTDRAGTDDGS